MTRKNEIDIDLDELISSTKRELVSKRRPKETISKGSDMRLFVASGLVLLVFFSLLVGGIFSPDITDNSPFTNKEKKSVESNSVITDLVLYRSPTCGCCHNYISYLEDMGVLVVDKQVNNRDDLHDKMGIPSDYFSCHTVKIGGYTTEGHIPIEVLEKLYSESPDIDGITLPGMPAGSPGMDGQKDGVWDIYSFKDGEILGIYESI